MNGDLVSIGEVARGSGLSVSALRFYDREGVLLPARVDPVTGYRWYADDQIELARLIAALRRVGLALPEVLTVLAHRNDDAVLGEVLAGHVGRLEAGLTAARAEIARIRARWWQGPAGATVRVDAAELARGLDSVCFAIGSDPDFPALHGVLLESDGWALRLTATDRYRAAFIEIGTSAVGGVVRVVLAADGVQALRRSLAASAGEATLAVGSAVEVAVAGRTLTCPLLDDEFPDLATAMMASPSAVVDVDRSWLAEVLRARPDTGLWAIGVGDDGEIDVAADHLDGGGVLLNAEFLSQAIDSIGGDQLRLDLCGPIGPLAIRDADDPRSFSVLMPVRHPGP